MDTCYVTKLRAVMTENPVAASPNTCRKTRGCPGPMQTGNKPTSAAPLPQKGSAPTAAGANGPCKPSGDPEEICRRKCGCMRTSDKLKQILQTFPGPQPPPGQVQAYMAKKYDKASGYSYGHDEKSCCRKPSPTLEIIDSIGSVSQHGSEKEKMDACHRCSLQRRAHAPGAHAQGPHVQAAHGLPVHGQGVYIQGPAQEYPTDFYQKQQFQPRSEGKPTSRSWQIVSELVSLVQLSVTATALALYYLIYCYMQLVYYTLRSALYFHNADGPMKITIGVVTVTSLIVGFNLLMRMEGIIGIVY
ncbi:hypothetical protein PYW08_011854 [Mythimna loreyi]|uniref:Uncharacterized protein n=1 Tax=Mythimna loreyi TaxID=667449 RepID=A0ACC2QQR7_9NEOP|nr:hypothetical protein PYW08_011854 [Mythimna loreyi]